MLVFWENCRTRFPLVSTTVVRCRGRVPLRYQYNTTHYGVLRTTNFNCTPFHPCRGETCRLFPSPNRFMKAPLFCFHPINSLSSANSVYVHMKNKKENNSFFCGGKRRDGLSWLAPALLFSHPSPSLLPFTLFTLLILVPLLYYKYISQTKLRLYNAHLCICTYDNFWRNVQLLILVLPSRNAIRTSSSIFYSNRKGLNDPYETVYVVLICKHYCNIGFWLPTRWEPSSR